MNNTKELVFIDESLVELDVLLESISNKTIFLLNHKTPLLSQMAQKLQDNKDIKAIHIITHGNSGELLLGDYVVSTTTLPLYSKEILTISDTMLEDGEIFLYGCEVAYGKKGEEFVTAFADYTNKKVAAASHKVGHTQFDASWELDMMPNIMMAQPLMVNEWRGVLAPNPFFSFENQPDSYDGDPMQPGTYVTTVEGVTLTVTNAVAQDMAYMNLSQVLGGDQNGTDAETIYSFSSAINISTIDYLLGNVFGRYDPDNLKIKFIDTTNGSTNDPIIYTFTSSTTNKETITLDWENVTSFKIETFNPDGTAADIYKYDTIDNIVFSAGTSAEPETTPFTLVLDGSFTWKRPNYLTEPDGVTSLDQPTNGAQESVQWGTFTDTPPFAEGTDLYSYSYVKFTVSENGNYSFKITDTTLDDAVIFLYGDDFGITDGTPSGTFIAGDDDSWDTYFDTGYDLNTGGTTTTDDFWPGLKDVELNAGTYYLVLSSFEAADTGTVTFEASSSNGTVSITGGTLITPYISGKEQMIINENDNGALEINGFTLGNAGDMNDTTTVLKVSIAAAQGRLTLGTTNGVDFTNSTNNGAETIEFKGTIADLRTAINSLSYDPIDDNTATDPLEIKISADNGTTWNPYTVDIPGKFYYAPNGHYYEFIQADGITWDEAKTAAEAKTLYGLKGYLVTVTSQAENDFITPKLGGDGWMGASDSTVEGTWKWVTGPEAGTQFYQGWGNADIEGPENDGYDSSYNSPVDGQFNNFANGEPNNWGKDEDFAHFYSTKDWNRDAGEWNDYAANNTDIQGYIVEYGGNGSDTFGTLTSAHLTIVTNMAPSLSNVETSVNFTETDLQTTPQLIDSDVSFTEDNYTLNSTGLYDNDYNLITGKLDITFVDDSDNSQYLSNEWLSFKTNGDIRISINSDGGEIYYQNSYIGQFESNSDGLEVVFDTTDMVSAVAVDALIQSLTYEANDAPSSASKIKIVVTDNTGLASTPVYVNVAVSAENDAPVLSTSTGLLRSNVALNDWDQAYSVALSDGSIIVAGASYGDSDVVKLAKYSANGVLDSSFGTSGIVTISLDNGFDEPSIAIDGNNKIIVAGYSDGQVAVMRFNINGTVDTDFAVDSGNVAFVSDSNNSAWSPKVAVLSGNSIAISYGYDGYDSNADSYVQDFAVAKLTEAGVLDADFGTDGVALVDIASGSNDEASDIKIDSDGNIVVVGTTSDANSGTDSIGLSIVNASTGAVVNSIQTAAVNGDVWSSLAGDVEGCSVAIQSDGKMVVAGSADGDGVILARYNTDGSLDSTFGTNGKVALASDVMYAARDIAIDSNGKILVLNDDGAMAVARFSSNGALDTTFGENGIAVVSGIYNPWASSMKIASDGTIWIVGGDDDGDDGAFNIAKLSANGVPDANFGSKATFTTYGDPIVLDGGISLFDGELSNYEYFDNGGGFLGATLTLERQGGADENDLFSAAQGSDLVFTDEGNVVYDGTTVGTFTQVSGKLTINFNNNATQYYSDSTVNDVMRNIAYSYADDTITNPTNINLVWTFNDGNTGDVGRLDQGSGGAKETTLVQTLNIAIGEPDPVSSVTLNVNNPFTTNNLNDTTPITIDAPDGINITDAQNSVVTGLPKNVKMPLGQFGFTLEGVELGATVDMQMTADADFKQLSYFKKSYITNKWVNIAEGVTINENGTATVKFSLKDGGEFDHDGIANGVIVDPGGIGQNTLLPLISENTTEVGNVSLLDETLVSGTVSYAITGGADAEKFTINSSTGLLEFKVDSDNNNINFTPDYENPTDAGDTANNNTYEIQVTLSGSTRGSEVQNLIVSVINVAEFGDNLNTAPVIVGLRADAQTVTVGTATALDNIRVVDANNDNMIVTLSATNGTIGGVTDADTNTEGIQLTGTATVINTALANATFTATTSGSASVNISVIDHDVAQGTAITTTGVYNLIANEASSNGGGSTPPTTVVDGATVQTGTTTETRTTTDSNGNTITTTVTTEQLVISPVGDNRTDSTGTATTADIPLFWGESGRTEWATTASLPTGFGLTTSGSRAPSQTATQQSVLADLIYYIDTTAPSTDLNKTQMLSGGSSFLSALGNIETLVVNKVTLTSSTTLASNTPITISGTTNGIVTTTGTQAPQEALVIDASSLPINTIIELENIEFAVIVGNNITIRGGDGQNTLFSGDGSQDIMLGADDDELHAGAGDDKVGSAGGNDKIFGESGNDTVFGGEGNDMLHGGSDIDVATYSGNISDYVITRDESKTYVALASNSQEKDTLINVESIKFADTNYVIETTVNQSQIATLYMQVLDRQAEIDGYQYWAYSGNELGAMAINFVKSEEYKIKSGVNWDSLNIEDKIETLYEAILGRNSDAQGKQNWIDYYNSGATIEQVAEGFVDSIELSGIYQNKEDWNFTL